LATISTYAGNHSLGGTYSGDNGPATSAGLCGPVGLHFFGGNLLIADSCNSAVRLVNSSGYISTPPQVPRSDLISSLGVGLDRNGYMYVADGDWGAIREFQGDNAAINLDTNMYVACIPDGIGNLYGIQGPGITTGNIVNQMHCVIPNYGSPDGIITTLASVNPNWSFYQNGRVVVASLTLDSHGNIYVADLGSHIVFMIDTSGAINNVAGTGNQGYNGDNIPALSADLSNPAGVAVRGYYLYIADSGNSRIRQVDLSTGIITTVAGTGVAGYNGDGGTATQIQLNMPSGLCVDTSGNLYISDTANDVVRKLKFCP
jgi:trimeric autotransporter adhesin